MITTKLNWLSVADGNVPQPTYETKDGQRTMSVSTELLCYDGKSFWTESYAFFEDEDHLQKNITHYIEIEKLKIGTETLQLAKLTDEKKTGEIQPIYLQGVLMPNGEIMSNGNSIGYENRYADYLYIEQK